MDGREFVRELKVKSQPKRAGGKQEQQAWSASDKLKESGNHERSTHVAQRRQ